MGGKPSVTRVVKFIRKGAAGTNAPYLELSRTAILYDADSSGYSTSAQSFAVTLALKVDGNACTIASTDNITVTTISNVTVTKNNTSKVTLTVANNKNVSGVVSIRVVGTYGGVSYAAQANITIEPNKKGDQGDQGTRGPALRGPQDWNLCTEYGSEDYQFYQGAEGEPYLDFVIYNGNYYVCKKSYTSKTILPTNSTYWTLSDKVAMIAASVLFAEHGFFGDAIISGQWLISANGTINGTTYTKGQSFNGELAYNLFNADSPLGADISKYNSTTAVSIGSSEATKNVATVTLEAGRVYYMSCVGYTSNASHPVYVRLVKIDDSSTVVTPVNLNSTSAVTRTGYAHITKSGTYYIQMYHDTGYTGTMNTCSLVEKCFAPFYAVNLRSGKVYQSDAYVKGQIIATDITVQGGTITGDLTVGSGSVKIKLQPAGSGSSVGAGIKAYDGTLTPFSLTFDRYYYGGNYAPHATLKLESVYPYSSQCGSITITDRSTERILYYGSSRIPDYTYRRFEGYESITNFSGMVHKLSVNNAYFFRMGITATGVACLIATAWPTVSDKANLPTGCVYRDGENLKVKT